MKNNLNQKFRQRTIETSQIKNRIEYIQQFANIFPSHYRVYSNRRFIGTLENLVASSLGQSNPPLQITADYFLPEITPQNNHLHKLSLVDKTIDGYTFYKYLAIEAPFHTRFLLAPTYKIFITQKRSHFIWEFNTTLPEEMKGSLDLLAQAICYVHPEAKSLFKQNDIQIAIPGYAHRISGIHSRLYCSGSKVAFTEIWDIYGAQFSIKGKSLQNFLNCKNIYVPNLKTTKQFIALNRLNIMLDIQWTKEEFFYKKRAIIFLMRNFLQDIGYSLENTENLLWRYIRIHDYEISDEEFLETRTLHSYKFKNETIFKMLLTSEEIKNKTGKTNELFKKFKFYEKKIDADAIRKDIATLANEGKTIKEISVLLNCSVSKVKRRRSEAVKLGLIPPKH